MSKFRILRFVERDLSIESDRALLKRQRQDLLKCCRSLRHRPIVIQTRGGCLQLLTDMRSYSHGKATTEEDFRDVVSLAEKGAFDCFLPKKLQDTFAAACDYLTLGVDVYQDDDACSTHAELVGVYDTKRGRFVAWTGKSYPLQWQASSLIHCNDLETHFPTLNGVSVLLLGCHDLNIFSPRSRACASPGTFKRRVMDKMDRLVRKYKPEVVLHHPHYTDSPRIWRVGWTGAERYIPSCHTYSSGIFYGCPDKEEPRGLLEDVLAKTAKGDVHNWIQQIF